jgi:ankyrin repeat protein
MSINYYNFCVNRVFTGKNPAKKFIFFVKEPSNGDFKMKKLSLCVGLCALALMFSGCSEKMDPNDPASVRKYITSQKIAFTPNQFISYVLAEDTAKVSLFLQATFEIDAPDANGNNAVAIVVNKGKLNMLEYLVNHGAKIDLMNSKGETALDDAIAMGHKDIVKFLVAKMQEKGILEKTSSSVNLAAKLGNLEIIQILGDAGAPLEIRGADTYYPIHLAVKGGHYDVVNYLISKNVDLNVTCGQGYSVLDWAKNEGYTRIITLLKKHGARNTAAYTKEFGH